MNTGELVKKPLGGCDKHPCLCTRHPFIEIFVDPTTKLDEQICFSSAGSAKSLRGMTRLIQLLLLHKCLSIGQCSIRRHFWLKMGPDMNMLCQASGHNVPGGCVGQEQNFLLPFICSSSRSYTPPRIIRYMSASIRDPLVGKQNWLKAICIALCSTGTANEMLRMMMIGAHRE